MHLSQKSFLKVHLRNGHHLSEQSCPSSSWRGAVAEQETVAEQL